MEIRKRNGEMAAFDAEKIRAAMRLAFTATNVEITEQSLNSLLRAVLKRLEEVQQLTVENVQDQVEQQLMAEGYCFATSSEPCRPSMSFRCSPQAVPAA